jgi:uncharacterized membrane protein YhiD involved in acid resistance
MLMNTLAEQFGSFADIGYAVSLSQAALCLIVSFCLCVIISKVYQFSYRGVSYSPAFMQTLVICGMVIGAVMLIIGSNIARAFSLVGALSIIRFRNAVKDPRDVAFIFLVMGVGMACGTGFYAVAVVLTIIVCSAIMLMTATRFGSLGSVERIIRIKAPITRNFEHIFDDVLKKFTQSFHLLSVEACRAGTEVELMFSVRVPENFGAEPLLEALSKVNDRLKVQIVGSAHTIDL